MNHQILNMVDQHRENSFFTHAEFNDETRALAEQKLGLRLPEQYVEYLKTFGHGGVGGVDILGVGCDGSLIFVEETLLYRKYGLPKNLVVVE
ncbi:SMI1/KNR4 family protein, partial [Collinsella sp. D33t1_170424_A12]|uniref:SMI1/KNR4 family protein n=1 Tax=Collinsella sp. D33t1_170424_A12 TaxID=2787135 RepID=UPI001899AE40